MRKGMLIGLALLVVPGLLLMTSCAKKQIKPQETTMSQADQEAAQRAEAAKKRKAAEEAARVKEQALKQQEMKEAQAAREAFVNDDVHFDFNSYVLTSDAQALLKKKAQWLEDNPDVHVMIEGNCDERGSEEYNLALGDRRAKSAKTFLVNLGIPASRLSTISYGEERPLDTAHTEAAWAKNRRDHFDIK